MNEDLAVERIGHYLDNKKIALCVSGGIAAIETPKVARQLRRMGADVTAYVTNDALNFVGKSALEWGTGKPVVDRLSGLAEHIAHHDAVLVCPATLNTAGKIAHGIADNPVTTLAASALGCGTPLYVAPTMHDSLFQNPAYQKNVAELAAYGAHFIEPRASEGKKKLAPLDVIAATLAHNLSDSPLKGKRMLITGGPTPVKIDAVRRITNVFKGRLGKVMATEAYLRGAEVQLLMGDTALAMPAYVPTRFHHDYDEYYTNVMGCLTQGYDIGVFSAAVADYRPQTVAEGKIPSKQGGLQLNLVETPKVIDDVRAMYPELTMVSFKYMTSSEKELLRVAQDRLSRFEYVVANRAADMVDGHQAFLLGRNQPVQQAASKQEIACKLMDMLSVHVRA